LLGGRAAPARVKERSRCSRSSGRSRGRLGSAQVAAPSGSACSISSPTTPRRCARCASCTRRPATSRAREPVRALGQEEELVDALLGIADRLDAKAQRIPLVERARSSRNSARRPRRTRRRSPRSNAPGRCGSACSPSSRRMSVRRARCLRSTRSSEKWARLIRCTRSSSRRRRRQRAAREDRADPAPVRAEARVAHARVHVTLRAFDLEPMSSPLYLDVLRLAQEARAVARVAAMFDKHLSVAGRGMIDDQTRSSCCASSRRSRAAGASIPSARARITAGHGPRAERSRGRAAPRGAVDPARDWPELLTSYRRRAAREKTPRTVRRC